jgi:hypothetical protein
MQLRNVTIRCENTGVEFLCGEFTIQSATDVMPTSVPADGMQMVSVHGLPEFQFNGAQNSPGKIFVASLSNFINRNESIVYIALPGLSSDCCIELRVLVAQLLFRSRSAHNHRPLQLINIGSPFIPQLRLRLLPGLKHFFTALDMLQYGLMYDWQVVEFVHSKRRIANVKRLLHHYQLLSKLPPDVLNQIFDELSVPRDLQPACYVDYDKPYVGHDPALMITDSKGLHHLCRWQQVV